MIRNKHYNSDVHYICKLKGIKSIEKIYGKLKNYDVVLTDERKHHIIKRRKEDSIFILNNIREVIEDYDFILDASSNCIRCVKFYDKRNIAFVIKLSLDDSNQGNSILSAVVMNMKKLNKILSRDRIIDSKL